MNDHATKHYLQRQVISLRQHATDDWLNRRSLQQPVRTAALFWTFAAMLPGAIALGVLILWLAGVVSFG